MKLREYEIFLEELDRLCRRYGVLIEDDGWGCPVIEQTARHRTVALAPRYDGEDLDNDYDYVYFT